MSRHRTPPALAAERRTPIAPEVALDATWAELLGTLARLIHDADRRRTRQ